MRKTMAVLTLSLACAAAGCTTYYKVTDPTTGRAYYTTELQQKGNGSATLKDARTGNKVNIQNSEIDEISKEEFETGKVAAPTATSSTPASAMDSGTQKDASSSSSSSSANPFTK